MIRTFASFRADSAYCQRWEACYGAPMPACSAPLNTEGNAERSKCLQSTGNYDCSSNAILTAQLSNMAHKTPGAIGPLKLRRRVLIDGYVAWKFYLPGLQANPNNLALPAHVVRASHLSTGSTYEVHLRLDVSPGYLAFIRFSAELGDQIQSVRILIRVQNTETGAWMARWATFSAIRGNAPMWELYARAAAALREAGQLPPVSQAAYRQSSGDQRRDRTCESLYRGTYWTTSCMAEDLNIAEFVVDLEKQHRRVYFPKSWATGPGSIAWFRVDQFGVTAVLRALPDDGPELLDDDDHEDVEDCSESESEDDDDEDEGMEEWKDEGMDGQSRDEEMGEVEEHGTDDSDGEIDDGNVVHSEHCAPPLGDFKTLAVAENTSPS